MLYNKLAYLLILLSFWEARAQNDLQLIANSGGSIIAGSFFFDFSLGEVVTGYTKGTSAILTEGFLQPIKKAEKPGIPEGFKIYEFVSANNDGKNETFYISNIKAFPGMELIIFNKEHQAFFERKMYYISCSANSVQADANFYVSRTLTFS